MTEETNKTTKAVKREKPPALEDKPFQEFIQEHFDPALKSALAEKGITDLTLNFEKTAITIDGFPQNEQYWQLMGNWNNGKRQFNLYFLEENIKGQKAFSYTTNSQKPSTIESFMIDERRITLDLMVLYTLQRLNGQKWLTRN